jgi:hypothetical protein
MPIINNYIIPGEFLLHEENLNKHKQFVYVVKEGGSLALGTQVSGYNFHWKDGEAPDFSKGGEFLITID